MKKTLLAGAISIVMSLGIPGLVSAKGPTVKITITGDRLTGALEVRNPRVLSSAGPWDGKFMDGSRGVLTALPGEPQPYEVSFYVKLRNGDTKMAYVVYYRPSPSPERGYIYLPGKGERWYRLNVSTILRTGHDGKWHYASPEWEGLIKPLIAGAKGAQRHGSGR